MCIVLLEPCMEIDRTRSVRAPGGRKRCFYVFAVSRSPLTSCNDPGWNLVDDCENGCGPFCPSLQRSVLYQKAGAIRACPERVVIEEVEDRGGYQDCSAELSCLNSKAPQWEKASLRRVSTCTSIKATVPYAFRPLLPVQACYRARAPTFEAGRWIAVRTGAPPRTAIKSQQFIGMSLRVLCIFTAQLI